MARDGSAGLEESNGDGRETRERHGFKRWREVQW